jgi:hypothetical protein
MARLLRCPTMLKALFALIVLSAAFCWSQVAAPNNAPPPEPGPAAGAASPMPYALSQALTDLDQVAQSAVRNLDSVRVDKWKTDSRNKDQVRENIQSLQRNLNAALPTLVQQVRQNPASVAALVKLYRNMNAVYDVIATVTENTGAFGSKDDYRVLATDVANWENVRRTVAEELEHLATNQDALVVRLRTQPKSQPAAASNGVPTRVIVDDVTPPKKKPKKKTAATPANPPATKPQ